MKYFDDKLLNKLIKKTLHCKLQGLQGEQLVDYMPSTNSFTNWFNNTLQRKTESSPAFWSNKPQNFSTQKLCSSHAVT